jgi:hypothetical protein
MFSDLVVRVSNVPLEGKGQDPECSKETRPLITEDRGPDGAIVSMTGNLIANFCTVYWDDYAKR